MVLEAGTKAWSTDHIFPQDNSKWEYSPEKLERLKERREQIGNLAPLPGSDNKSVGNKSFVEKSQYLKDKWSTGMATQLCNCYSESTWTGPKIEKRSKMMVAAIKECWY